MDLAKTSGWLVACVALGGAFQVWRGWDGDEPHPQRAVRQVEAVAPPRIRPPSIAANTNGRPVNVEQSQGTALQQANILAADDLKQEWDELGSAKRMQYLEGRFGTALAAIEAGEQPIAKHAFVAESVLSSMRAELYDTPSGQAQHRSHEARLDRALGGVVPRDEGALK